MVTQHINHKDHPEEDMENLPSIPHTAPDVRRLQNATKVSGAEIEAAAVRRDDKHELDKDSCPIYVPSSFSIEARSRYPAPYLLLHRKIVIPDKSPIYTLRGEDKPRKFNTVYKQKLRQYAFQEKEGAPGLYTRYEVNKSPLTPLPDRTDRYTLSSLSGYDSEDEFEKTDYRALVAMKRYISNDFREFRDGSCEDLYVYCQFEPLAPIGHRQDMLQPLVFYPKTKYYNQNRFPALDWFSHRPYRLWPIRRNGIVCDKYKYDSSFWKKAVRETTMLSNGFRAFPNYHNKNDSTGGILSTTYVEEVAARGLVEVKSREPKRERADFDKLHGEVQGQIYDYLLLAPRILAYKPRLFVDPDTKKYKIRCCLVNKMPTVPVEVELLHAVNGNFTNTRNHMLRTYKYFEQAKFDVSPQFASCEEAGHYAEHFPWFNAQRDVLVIDELSAKILYDHNVGLNLGNVLHVIMELSGTEKDPLKYLWQFCHREFPLLRSLGIAVDNETLKERVPTYPSHTHFQFRIQCYREKEKNLVKQSLQKLLLESQTYYMEFLKWSRDEMKKLFPRENTGIVHEEGCVKIDLVNVRWFVDNQYSALWTKRFYLTPRNPTLTFTGLSYFMDEPYDGAPAYTKSMYDEDERKLAVMSAEERFHHSHEHNGVRRVAFCQTVECKLTRSWTTLTFSNNSDNHKKSLCVLGIRKVITPARTFL